MSKGVVALDADGVLLDYGLAYAGAWQKAFGVYPRERTPSAYWPIERWEVELLDGERLEEFQRAFDDDFWASIPPLPGAVDACRNLVDAGYELICVTALASEFRLARERNLRQHGFPIDLVHVTGHVVTAASPKADALNELKPLAFVDDFLPYFLGVDSRIHRALVVRDPVGSPNVGELLEHVDSKHLNLASFANWWLGEIGGAMASLANGHSSP